MAREAAPADPALVPLALAGVAFAACAQLGGRITAVRASFALQMVAWLCGANLPLEMLAAALTGRIRHAPPPHDAAWIAANLVGFAALMLVALRLPPLAAWAYHARAYPRLRGLWEPLRAATGGYLLPYPELARRWSLAVWRDPEKYTAYLCGALRDDALRLSGWVADGVLGRAGCLAHQAGAPAGPVEATRDAICLHYALLRHGQAPAAPPRGGWALGGLDVADIAGEVAYLCRVARAFRAPEIRQLALRLAADEPDGPDSWNESWVNADSRLSL